MRRDPQPDPLAQLANHAGELCEPYPHAEKYWDTRARRQRIHIRRHPPLLRQLRAAVHDRPPANLDAIHALLTITADVTRWRQRTNLPACHDLDATIRALVGAHPTLTAGPQRALAAAVARWWSWCQVLTGWQEPPFRPNVPCPTCGQRPGERAGLRVRLDLHRAICLSCETTWDPVSIHDLAAHIRAATALKEPPVSEPTQRRTLVELPDGAVVLEVVEVVGYIDLDGRRRWAVRCGTDVPLSTTLGLLRIAEHAAIAASEEEIDP